MLDEARATFQFQGEVDTHLVLSNKKRKRINLERNEATRPPDARLLEANDGKIYLHLGLKLQRRATAYATGSFMRSRAWTTTP